MSKLKHIGVLTSGGDAPGMNCAIRSVVRTAIGKDVKVSGIRKGYSGLLEGDFVEMNVSSVGNILQRGGTILQTSRCKEFHEKATRKEAANILKRKNIDALIVIGGDGSFNGAHLLSTENDIPVVGIPGTIDNDISGTQYTIGFDTAVQTATEAVDKIRDTASSHARNFIIEVMGRSSSAIAIHVGVCSGAENIVLPNKETNFSEIAEDIKRGISRGKNSSIIVVAEGQNPGASYELQKELEEKHGLYSHVCILGHTQRGGRPTSLDRFLASKMGYDAVMGCLNGEFNTVTSFLQGKVQLNKLENCLKKNNDYDLPYLDLVRSLAI